MVGIGEQERGRRSDWDSFEDFELAWHTTMGFRYPVPRPPAGSMYYDGQFDEFPYYIWEEVMEE